MARFTVIIGIMLIALGVLGYSMTGRESVTALIPAFFGLPLGVLGWIGLQPERVKLTMHIAVVMALIGLIGSVRGIPAFVEMMSGGEVARPGAAVAQTLMALICGVYVVASIRSFVQARLRRKAG
ncbi:MAG TPA: hypothetical protein ENN56_03290 [Firmicutes bacterium]|nr:hypothetical protein [Bacillota bacterium]